MMRKPTRLACLTSIAFCFVGGGCNGNVVIGNGPGSGDAASPSHKDAATDTRPQGDAGTGSGAGDAGAKEAGGQDSNTSAAVPEPKVDLLFDIDNSASMGDKQLYLQQAIPEMIARLVTPRCIDKTTGQPNGKNADATTGQCPEGQPEFVPVHDMHIGIVTSSLGPRLGDACTSTTNVTSVRLGSVSGPAVQRRPGAPHQPHRPLRGGRGARRGGLAGGGRLPQLVPVARQRRHDARHAARRPSPPSARRGRLARSSATSPS